MMKAVRYISACLLLALPLSACGDKPGERALSGAGIGAGVGALGGALAGSPATGAAIGAGAGALAGAATNKDQVNLGKPVWR